MKLIRIHREFTYAIDGVDVRNFPAAEEAVNVRDHVADFAVKNKFAELAEPEDDAEDDAVDFDAYKVDELRAMIPEMAARAEVQFDESELKGAKKADLVVAAQKLQERLNEQE